MSKIAEVIEQLIETYRISKEDIIPIIESVIKHSITSYYGKDADVYYNGEEYEITIYNGEAMPTKLNLNKTSKNFIAFLRKQLTDRLLIEKTLSNYRAIRHLQGSLVGGYMLEKVKGYYLIKLNDIPFETKNILPLTHIIPNEQLKFNEFCFFLVSKIDVVKNNHALDLLVYLSRISKNLPVLLLQKAVEERTGVNIDCKCVKRVVGKFSILKTKIRLPNGIINFVQENLNGEKVIVRRS